MFCKKDGIEYLGIPQLLGVGTKTVSGVKYRFIVTNLGNLRDYNVLSAYQSISCKFAGEIYLDSLSYMNDAGYIHNRVTSLRRFKEES